jgi:adenylate cyclase
VSESNYGDFEFERKFYCREMPAVAALDPRPELILQAYLFAADGYAVRVRLQGPAPTEVNASLPDLIEALGHVDADAIGTMTAKGPATGGTRYEASSRFATRHGWARTAGSSIGSWAATRPCCWPRSSATPR